MIIRRRECDVCVGWWKVSVFLGYGISSKCVSCFLLIFVVVVGDEVR